MSLKGVASGESLAGVRLGMRATEVEATLGAPEATSLKKGRPSIFRYGGLQVFFGMTGTCSGLAVYFRRGPLSQKVMEAVSPLFAGCSEKDAERALMEQGLAPTPIAALTFGDQKCIRLARGLHVVFGEGVVDSVQMLPPEQDRSA